MSEIVNEATIKVVADASGVEVGLRKVTEHTANVEAGLKRVDDTAKKTGRTLENLSSGPGLRNVGEGAGAAAGQVDRATKNMADSIQRATATMSVGAKGSREYFEALANSRGINVATLRPYLDQLDAVTRKTALAAEAQRQLEASNRFLEGLRAQAEGIGKTASQMAALRAEQLGVADAARPMIEQLRAAEEAAGDAEGSFGNFASALAAVGFGGGIAAIAQISDEYGKYVSQLKLATAGQTEFANAQVAVRRIATSAQSDLSATGALYASISKSTRELGLAQRQIADITETVSLALKVSGASGEEASSAILQLSQAFASGTLRGDEFNSVNEAAPRLMQALADGLGVPIGALRKMAEEGELTTAILSGALPRALGELRTEAQSVQTIGGAFTVLKNNVMEAVGATAQSSGVVKLFSGAIGLLADNLTLAAGAAATFAAVKVGTALSSAATQALAAASANRALTLSNLETARASVAATAAASTLAAARVAELRAAVAAAEGNVALAITTNGLIPAQARATAAAAAHTAALSAQAAAAGSASVAGGLLRGALGLLGGPVGAVITLLGVGATAWALWGESSKKAGENVSESVKASTEEVIEGLDKQISKLREHNGLASAGFKPAEIQSPGGERLGEIMAQIDRAGRGAGEYTNLSLDARTEILKVLGRQYGDLTAKIAEFNRESEIDTANQSAKSVGEWMQKYATNAEKMNAEIDKAKKDLGAAFTPELEARIRKQYDETSKGAEKAEDAYRSLIASIKEKIQATSAEAAGMEPLTESQRLQISLDEQLRTGKLSLTAAHKAEYEAALKKLAANEAMIESNKRAQASDALHTKGLVAADAELKSIAEQVRAQQRANEEIGLTAAALAKLQASRLEDAASQKEQTAAALEFMQPGNDLAATYREQASELRALAAAKLDGANLQASANVDLTGATEVLKVMEALDESARQAAAGMESAFGRVGKTIGGLTTSISGLGRTQAAIAAQLAAATKAAGGDPAKIAAANSAAARQTAQAQIRSYGDMAGAAKNFFDEHSRGYQVMEAAEKGFRAYEMAMAVKSLAEKSGLLSAFTGLFVSSKATETAAEATSTTASTALAGTQASAWGVTAVVKAIASMPFPLNIAAGAATMAAVVAIGAKMFGRVSSGGMSLSESRQATQGTGSVLGDSTAKSESIAKAIELSAANSNIELNYTAGMLRALLSIESSLGNLGGLLIRSGSVGGALPSDIKGSGYTGASAGALGGMIGVTLDKITGGFVSKTLNALMPKFLSNAIGKVGNAIFGGNVTTLDGGIMANATTLGSARVGGLNASSYVDTKKDGGWFRSDKYRTATTSLGQEANQQFGLVLANMADAIGEAGTLLGIGGDAFTQRLNAFVVDLGKISTKGLKAEEIQAQLEAAFSKIGDDMARWSVAGLTQFQKVGEGALETLVRVAANYANLDAILASVGKTFGATGLASIDARERLIDLAGGIDELASKTAGFAENFLTEAERLAPVQKYVADQLASMGLASLRSRESFKQYVLGLDLTSEAQRQQYVALMDLQEAFAKVYPEIVDATMSVADAKAALVDAYDAEVDAIGSAIDRMGSFAKGLRDLSKSALLGSLSPLTPEQKYVEARSQYEVTLAAARAGDEAAQGRYQEVYTAFLEASRAINASGAGYQRDFGYAQAMTEEAARWAEGRVDQGQAQLDMLRSQVSGIIEVNKSVLSVRDALLQYQAAMARETAPLTAVAPPVSTPIPYNSYGTQNTEALVAEVKALRTELAGLRAEQRVQTGDQITATTGASEESATFIARAVQSAVREARANERVFPE